MIDQFVAHGLRPLVCWLLLCLACAFPVLAQDTENAPTEGDGTSQSTAVTDKVDYLLELGQLYMGQNNPQYARKPATLDFRARTEAGTQALRIFEQITTRYPQSADGWLWLGIAHTERLRFSPSAPGGELARTKNDVPDGLRAFRTANECAPTDLVYASYYGEALMVYLQDFDGARKLWDDYLLLAKTDMQRVTALTQAARACLNKGYFGAVNKSLTPQIAKKQYLAAEEYITRAAKISPQSADVKAMQALLTEYRTTICGK